MRRITLCLLFLGFGLACSGVVADLPLPTDAEGDDDDDAAAGDDDDDDDDENPEPRDIAEATADCTVDIAGVLVGLPGFGGPKKEQAKGQLELKKAPTDKAKTLGVLSAKGLVPTKSDKPFCKGGTGDDACVTAPVALEHFGVPVYQEKDGWALIGMGKGGNIFGEGSCQRRVWVEVKEPLKVRTATELLNTDMAYVRKGMEIELFDDAGGEPLEEQPETGDEEVAARVIRSEEVDGRIWVKVELYDQLPCDGDQEEIAEGWMPLHDDAGRIQMWFHTDC